MIRILKLSFFEEEKINMKLTKNRIKILNIIKESAGPVNAKLLKEKVPFNISTVYRSLDFLERNNYIYSFNVQNETYYIKEPEGHFLICGQCNRIETLPGTSGYIDSEEQRLRQKGFFLMSHLSIFKGRCIDCNS